MRIIISIGLMSAILVGVGVSTGQVPLSWGKKPGTSAPNDPTSQFSPLLSVAQELPTPRPIPLGATPKLDELPAKPDNKAPADPPKESKPDDKNGKKPENGDKNGKNGDKNGKNGKNGDKNDKDEDKDKDKDEKDKDDKDKDEKDKDKDKDEKDKDDKDKDKDKDKDEPAKTLFEWLPGKKKKDDENEAPEEDKIVTDRPDFTESSQTVGQGRFQVEMGYTYTKDKNGTTQFYRHSYPEMLFRVGMFADWFEWRLAFNYARETERVPGTTTNVAGVEDLYLGVKLALAEQKGIFPEMALVLQALVPSGNEALTSQIFQPGFNLLYSWDLTEKVGLAMSTQLNRRRDGVSHAYVEFAQSASIGVEITKRVGAYTEWFCFVPTGSLDPDTGPEHYLNGGFTYLFTNYLQFDIRAGVGLNQHAADTFAGAGVSYKY